MSDNQTNDQANPKIIYMNEEREKLEFKRTINFKYRSEIDGKEYNGTFTFRKLTLGDISRIAVIRAQLSGGFPFEVIDPNTLVLNGAIAHLRVWFENDKTVPEWARDPSTLIDPSVAIALFTEGMSFEDTFRSKRVG